MKIYTNVEAIPSRVLALVKFLALRGPVTKEELYGLLQPRKDQAMAQKVLDAVHEMELVEVSGDSVSLAKTLAKEPCDEDDNRSLRREIGRLALRPEVAGTTNGFAVICAWMLSLDLESVPENHAALKSALEADGLKLSDLQAQSDARWDNILYWIRFLGLSCRLGETVSAFLVPDPTEYLTLHLDALVKPGEEVKVTEFSRRLATSCPVMDGGKVRQAIMGLSSRSLPADTLSSALSFGLLRLESRGLIKLSSPPDERTFVHLHGGERRLAYIARKK